MKLLIVLVPIVLGATGSTSSEDTWPTPYTAEQIRDAWVKGFWLESRTVTPDGEHVERVEVVEWSKEGAVLRTQTAVSDDSSTTRESSVQWEQLRLHALFSKSNTERARETRTTPLGTYEGWRFLRTTDGSSDEFFFADSLPGPPIVFSRKSSDDELMFEVTQIARFGIDEQD